ncbi:MAG: DUF484 family protein, partial [Gammaproteobacteria bacterium]|nr:DUF484 family protein [Gammaproteobacteria bacterium]
MPNSKAVADYLESHPDFFASRGALLAAMQLPEEFATPFHARQAQALRDRQARLDRMLETVKVNQNLDQELHQFAVELLGMVGDGRAAAPDAAAAAIAAPMELLKTRFDLDAAAVFLDAQRDSFDPGLDYASLCNRVEHLGGVCDDRVSSKLSAALFPAAADVAAGAGAAAPAVASCAFVPLARGRQLRGVMVLGDADRARFQPGMGALILDRLGQLVSAYLAGRGLL